MEILELRNGLKVLLKYEGSYPIVAGSLFFPLGSSADSPEGITLLTLRTAFKGSLKYSPEEFFRLQESSGSPFVPDVSCDYSLVKFQFVSQKGKEYLKLLLDVLTEPGFREDSFQVEKASLLASIRSKKESSFALAYEELMRRTYPNHPYSKLPYGTIESVSSLEVDSVKSWFFGNFPPKGTVLSLCGRIEGLEEAVKEFEELNSVPVKAELPPCSITCSDEAVVKREGSEQSFILVGLNAPSVFDRDYPAYKLLNTLLGEGIGSVLFQELREKRGYAYSTGSLFPSRRGSGRLLAYIGTSPEKEGEVKRELHKILKNLPDFVTPERVKRAKEYFRGTYLLDHELRSKRAWYCGFWEVLGKGWSYDGKFVEEVLSTTRNELLKAAESLSQSPEFTVVVKDG